MSLSRRRRNQLRKSFLIWKRQLLSLSVWNEDTPRLWTEARRAAMREARTWDRLIRLRGPFTGKPLRERRAALEGVKRVQLSIGSARTRTRD